MLVGQALRENLTTSRRDRGHSSGGCERGKQQLEPTAKTQRWAAPVAGRLPRLRVHPRLHRPRTQPARRAAPVPRHRRRRRPPRHGRPGDRRRRRGPRAGRAGPRHGIALLDQAADIGLLTSLGGGYYTIHPALPWYFADLFTHTYTKPGHPEAIRPARAYTRVLANLGQYYATEADSGKLDRMIPVLKAEEANLRYALALAESDQDWENAVRCMTALNHLYQYAGRTGEWSRLVAQVTPGVTDVATDQPLPGQEETWNIIISYRVQLAMRTRDWPTATRLQQAAVVWSRQSAAGALATPATQLTPGQRNQLRNLIADLQRLGEILRQQDDPGCLAPFQEALGLCQRTGARQEEAIMALNVGAAYELPGLRDLDQAEHWYRYSLGLHADHDRTGRSTCLVNIGDAAFERFKDAQPANLAEDVILGHLNAALQNYRQALSLTAADAPERLALISNKIGITYARAGETRQALDYYQQAVRHNEEMGNLPSRAGSLQRRRGPRIRAPRRRRSPICPRRASRFPAHRTRCRQGCPGYPQLIVVLEREVKNDKSPKP